MRFFPVRSSAWPLTLQGLNPSYACKPTARAGSSGTALQGAGWDGWELTLHFSVEQQNSRQFRECEREREREQTKRTGMDTCVYIYTRTYGMYVCKLYMCHCKRLTQVPATFHPSPKSRLGALSPPKCIPTQTLPYPLIREHTLKP